MNESDIWALRFGLLLLLLPACGREAIDKEADGADTGTDSDSGTAPADSEACAAAALFGLPSAKTGLTSAQCIPSRTCGGKSFAPPAYTEADIEKIEAKTLANPFPPLTADPYDHPELHVPQKGAVCGLHKDGQKQGGYRLQTYDSAAAATAKGAVITHYDGCGLCSPLTDLAVYMRYPDLTEPVRQCGLGSILGGEAENIACLQELGFDLPCAQIWYYNTKHTQKKCLAVCLAALDKPYHEPDGTLNDCLLCDEEQSGKVFKAVAGRTRRNTGLPSSMCRPCSEVEPVYHDYD